MLKILEAKFSYSEYRGSPSQRLH